MTEHVVQRWFKGELSSGEAFAVYRANFAGTTYLGEEQWLIKGDFGWTPSTRVQEWYFIGKDNIWECTQGEAAALLPTSAFLP